MVDLAAAAVLILFAATVLSGGYYLFQWVRSRRRGAVDDRFLRLLLVGLGYLAGLFGAILLAAALSDFF